MVSFFLKKTSAITKGIEGFGWGSMGHRARLWGRYPEDSRGVEEWVHSFEDTCTTY